MIREVPPPVVRGMSPPIIDVPNAVIEYPVIDVPTENQWRGVMGGKDNANTDEGPETRELPPSLPPEVTTPKPTITIGGIEAPLPEPAPLITAGATALVTTAVTLGATIAFTQLKKGVEPLLKQATRPKKKKIKIKQVKPVLHYVMSDEGQIDILEYSQKGTRVVERVGDVEKYIRDQIDNDSFYEYDNKIIIDDAIKEKFTKEGTKRFKTFFAPAKVIAKKLGSKFSI